jgi:hypothetical protein
MTKRIVAERPARRFDEVEPGEIFGETMPL